jgi:hypothetical protein
VTIPITLLAWGRFGNGVLATTPSPKRVSGSAGPGRDGGTHRASPTRRVTPLAMRRGSSWLACCNRDGWR